MSNVHQLKTWPQPFDAVWNNNKRHEVRVNDRDFRTGDVLHLHEYDPGSGYTGRYVEARVSHITGCGEWGLPANLCVMSLSSTIRYWEPLK